MADLNIVVAGASGRMGRTLIREIAQGSGIALCGTLEVEGHPNLGLDSGTLAGMQPNGIKLTADPLPLLAHAQAVVDFTTPMVSTMLADLAAQARIVHVIGTTGFDAKAEARVQAAARHAVIVKSGNMSMGVNLLAALAERAAKSLADYDIEILEMHHRNKVDAPSGTALLLGQAAAKGRGITLEKNWVKTRDGHTGARKDGDIGFATLRGGSVVGEHSVIFAGTGERITLSHSAEDRSIFAHGALTAAKWQPLAEELRFFFISGDVTVSEVSADDVFVLATPTTKSKCVRCWHHRADVGQHAAHPELCGRCVVNIDGAGEERVWF